MLALHGGGGGEAGGLAALVLRLLRQPGQVLPLSLRPVLVSLQKTNLNYFITRNIFLKRNIFENRTGITFYIRKCREFYSYLARRKDSKPYTNHES